MLFAACAGPEAAREHEHEGLRLLAAGRAAEARAELERALELDPGLLRAAVLLAEMYERGGQTERALAVLQALVEAEPDLGLGLVRLAELYTRLGLDEQALALYERAGAMGLALAYVRAHRIHRRRGAARLAEQALLKALALHPTYPEALYELARLYDEHGAPQARAAWERYAAVAAGLEPEAARLAEAQARLLRLGADLEPPVARALLASARELLRPPAGGRLDPGGAARWSGQPPAELMRLFPGRVIVSVYAELPGAAMPPLRGVGRGETLAEGLLAAVQQAREQRTYALLFAPRLAQTRLRVELEAAPPLPIAADGRAAAGGAADEPAPPGFVPGRHGVELRLADGRTALLTAADLADRGLAELGAALRALAAELALGAEGWRQGQLFAIETAGYLERTAGAAARGASGRDEQGERARGPAAAADSAVVQLEGGLVVRPPADRAAVRAAAAAAATHLAASLGREGWLVAGYDPVADRPLEGALSGPAQWRAVAALAQAARVLEERRLEDAAHVLQAALRAGAPAGSDLEVLAERALAALACGEAEQAAALGRALAARAAAAASAPPAPQPPGGQAAAAELPPRLVRAAAALAAAAPPGLETAPLLALVDAQLARTLEQVRAAAPAGAAPLAADLLAAAALRAPHTQAAQELLAVGRAQLRAPAPPSPARPVALERLEALLAVHTGGADDPPWLGQALQQAASELLMLQLDELALYPFAARQAVRGALRTAPLDPTVRNELVARAVQALLQAEPLVPERQLRFAPAR
ncbi:MAG: hypothetical protein KatS3mg102_1212 [Planctomycetota bacterium]|nr:MAG: hypothetical protein KatS3mg102_1212 [Planctomycetota bacterium]